ncbi:MAG: F0F1 ATP synthase subunit B [Verrucomicrobia bacterium]|nr:F0F1 ATP synthase subunit B [Verrucomicrobiota bacterium]
MSTFPLLAAAAGDKSIPAQIAETFGWNAELFISQVISFCVVAFLLHKFAYKPILGLLEERRQKIADSLANADRIKTELAQAQAKAQELLNGAGIQANKIIEEARSAAAKVTEQETQKAVAAAQDIINKARQSNDAELTRMKAELRREIGRLAVQAAMQVTGKILTAEDQQRLVEQTNRELAA